MPRPVSTVVRRIGVLTAALATAVAGTVVGALADPPSAAAQASGLPTFRGDAQPVPAQPVAFRPQGTMRAAYQADLNAGDGTDFWFDRVLARRGADPAGDWLLTRGRAVFSRSHDPAVVGFGGDMAYWDTLGVPGFEITFNGQRPAEDVSRRVQTPSSYFGIYRASGIEVAVRKYITQQNTAVADVSVRDTDASATTVPVRVTSPLTPTTEGGELTGARPVKNNLTVIYPRLSGDGLNPANGALTTNLNLAANGTTRFKVQLGFPTDENPQARSDYDTIRGTAAQQAWTTHVRAYNAWWADNLPTIDLPEQNIEKSVLYRWWLLRYNMLDADIPGRDYQFPTAIEGVLGYNNAIALTVPMFVDDLKYLRDPTYAYGTWLSAGEVSGGGRYVDNPGDPENWSNSYTQYTSEAAWRSYQIHGGPVGLASNLARYALGDVRDQLRFYDSNNNGLIEYDWGALTGNDADAVSFDWQPNPSQPTRPVMDRAESAYVYSNALAGAAAADAAGDSATASELRSTAERVRQAHLNVLWNPQRRLLEHRRVNEGAPHVPWKEINNYYPWAVGLMPNNATYNDALRLWADESQYPMFPFFTANQADKRAAAQAGHPGSNNFSVINSTVNFRFLASALRRYPTSYITNDHYKRLLYWNAWSHFINGDNRYPDQNEFWANYNPSTGQIDYRSWIHHTMLGATNWTIIEDVAGLRPRSDNRIELSPIDIGWSSFAVADVRYRGQDVAVVWNKRTSSGLTYADQPEGYSLFVDGTRVATLDRLAPFTYDPSTGQVSTSGATVLFSRAGSIRSMTSVDLSSTRVPTLAGQAGIAEAAAGRNLARGATTSASYTAQGTSTAGAVDGSTARAPIWGTRGSTAASDTYEVRFGSATAVNDVRLYFTADRRPNGYVEPARYNLEYQGTDGVWRAVANTNRTPAYPQANRNQVRFGEVTAQAIRVVLTHQPGYSTGLTEIQAFRTGAGAPQATDVGPRVRALVDTASSRPGQALLRGSVLDDGGPGTLSSTWSTVSGPGTVTFSNAAAPTTTATFSAPGTYVMRLTGSDGSRSASAQVSVVADAFDNRINLARFATPTASYTSPWENLGAVNDGAQPSGSNAPAGSRWGTWPNQGEHTVEYKFDRPVRLTSSRVYFFDDGGGVRVPSSWKLQGYNGSGWVDVSASGSYRTDVNTYNSVTFNPVTTDRFRMVLIGSTAAVGLVEWQVFSDRSGVARPVHIPTNPGVVPTMPETVDITGIYADGGSAPAPVRWPQITAQQVANGGTSFPIVGELVGQAPPVPGTVWVRANPAVSITSLAEESVTVPAGTTPVLPRTVLATYNDGSRDSRIAVTWDATNPASFAQPGTVTVRGTVPGTSLRATTVVTVVAR